MLTERALRERKWGEFPVLRKVLESEKPSHSYHGQMSTSDTMFAQIERFMVMAATAEEHRGEVLEAVRESSEGAEPLEADLGGYLRSSRASPTTSSRKRTGCARSWIP